MTETSILYTDRHMDRHSDTRTDGQTDSSITPKTFVWWGYKDNILFHAKQMSHVLFTPFQKLMTQEAFVDSVDQDQTAQNVKSDL